MQVGMLQPSNRRDQAPDLNPFLSPCHLYEVGPGVALPTCTRNIAPIKRGNYSRPNNTFLSPRTIEQLRNHKSPLMRLQQCTLVHIDETTCFLWYSFG